MQRVPRSPEQLVKEQLVKEIMAESNGRKQEKMPEVSHTSSSETETISLRILLYAARQERDRG